MRGIYTYVCNKLKIRMNINEILDGPKGTFLPHEYDEQIPNDIRRISIHVT